MRGGESALHTLGGIICCPVFFLRLALEKSHLLVAQLLAEPLLIFPLKHCSYRVRAIFAKKKPRKCAGLSSVRTKILKLIVDANPKKVRRVFKFKPVDVSCTTVFRIAGHSLGA